MTRPRSSLISVTDTPWYHVVSRCVRQHNKHKDTHFVLAIPLVLAYPFHPQFR